jgi:DNA-binding NtrC family response regulator
LGVLTYSIYEGQEFPVEVMDRRFLSGLPADQNRTIGRYRWPRNIRKLKNIVERAVLLSVDNQLEINLPAEMQGKEDHPFADFPPLEDVQRRYIRDVLKRTGGAAEILDMKRTSLYARMRALGMKRREGTPFRLIL